MKRRAGGAGNGRVRRASQAGYSLVALVAATTIMLIAMGAAVPSWRYVMKNEREEELIFRGGQIADAIQRYQRKRGNALPVSLDVLVKERFLRKAYKDPMTPDGKWRFLPPGAVRVPHGRPGGRPGQPPPTLIPGQSTTGPGGQKPTVIGPFIGVASLSTEKSLRIFNNGESYDAWWFVVGQPRFVGRPPRLAIKPGVQVFPSPPSGGPNPRPFPPPPPRPEPR